MDEKLYYSVIWYAVFLFSVVLHEAAHAYVALRGGDPTAYHGGQVTLDPVPHIQRSPFGMVALPVISLFLIGFPIGFASAPYNPAWAYDYPRRAGYMSLAGPLSNLSLVIVSGIIIHLGIWAGIFEIPHSIQMPNIVSSAGGGIWDMLALVIGIVFSLNLILTALNLIPLPPLDGSGAITLLMSEHNARRFRTLFSNSMLSIFVLLVAWKLFSPVFSKVFLIVVNILYPGSDFQ